MIGEHLQDAAIGYVLGDLSATDAARFHATLQSDAELRKFVRGIEASCSSLALAVPAVAPPSGTLPGILNEIRASAPQSRPIARSTSTSWIPWAMAACFAIACGALALKQAALKRELAAWRSKDEVATMRIATLTAQIGQFQNVSAVVVWNAKQQRGVAELANLPPLDEQHDYQLWVIDPAQPQPVSAGIVYVEPNGSARVVFQPVLKIDTAQKFAISVESKGGTRSPQGQIVLAGN